MRFNFIRVWGGFWALMGSKLFYPQATGRVIDELYAIQDKDTNIFIYSDGKNTLCFDAGYINNTYLENEFDKIGINPSSITHLFLTHMDMDHAGSLDKDSRANWFKQAHIFVGRNEEGLLKGVTPRNGIILNPVQFPREYTLLDDGEVISVGSVTVQAIATPGHTPGHMAYVINSKILCSGDALVLKDGIVQPFYATWNMNNEMVEPSVRKLAELENISVLCTAHTKCSSSFENAMNAWRKDIDLAS